MAEETPEVNPAAPPSHAPADTPDVSPRPVDPSEPSSPVAEPTDPDSGVDKPDVQQSSDLT